MAGGAREEAATWVQMEKPARAEVAEVQKWRQEQSVSGTLVSALSTGQLSRHDTCCTEKEAGHRCFMRGWWQRKTDQRRGRGQIKATRQDGGNGARHSELRCQGKGALRL